MKWKDACSLEGKLWQPRQCIKKERYHFADKGPYSQSYGFSSSHVRMWQLDHKESWAVNNCCFLIEVLEKTLESPLDCKRSNQYILKEISPEYSLERRILWPPDVKSWLTGKDPDDGRYWGQEEKGMTEDEIIGWHQLTWWTWVWVNSGSWWWTGGPGVLQFMGSQRVSRDWATELN